MIKQKKKRIIEAFCILVALTLLVYPFPNSQVSASGFIQIISTEDDGYSESEPSLWGQSSSLLGYNDIGIRFTNRFKTTATWQPNIPEPMALKVSYYKVPDRNTDKMMQFEINYDGNNDMIENFDPTLGEEEWIEIGTYYFSGEGNEYVKMTRMNAELQENTRVSAMKFEQVEGNPPSPQDINVEIAYTLDGNPSLGELEAGRMVEATAVITNDGEETQNVMLIVTLYNSDGAMLDIVTASSRIKTGESIALRPSGGFRLPENITGHVVEAFVWSGSKITSTNMLPLSSILSLPGEVE